MRVRIEVFLFFAIIAYYLSSNATLEQVPLETKSQLFTAKIIASFILGGAADQVFQRN